MIELLTFICSLRRHQDHGPVEQREGPRQGDQGQPHHHPHPRERGGHHSHQCPGEAFM